MTILRVKDNAPGPTHDGYSWGTAFQTIEEGLAALDTGDQLIIAKHSTDAYSYTTTWTTLKNDVEVYGGFDGVTVVTAIDNDVLRARDLTTNETILDGLHNPGVVDGHEIMHLYTNCIVDGFTFRNGLASSPYGIVRLGKNSHAYNCKLKNCYGSSVTYSELLSIGSGVGADTGTVEKCEFTDNTFYGYPMFDVSSGSYKKCLFKDNINSGGSNNSLFYHEVAASENISIDRCVFENNTVSEVIYSNGFNQVPSTRHTQVNIINSLFIENTVTDLISFNNIDPTYLDYNTTNINSCTFYKNSSTHDLILNTSTNVNRTQSIRNCIFDTNTVGGGFYNIKTCDDVYNCSFSGTSATALDGVTNYGDILYSITHIYTDDTDRTDYWLKTAGFIPTGPASILSGGGSTGTSTYDLAGFPRPSSTDYYIGAYQAYPDKDTILSNLRILITGYTELTADWDMAGGVYYTKIDGRIGSVGPYIYTVELGEGITEYTATGLTHGIIYYIQVKVYFDWGESSIYYYRDIQTEDSPYNLEVTQIGFSQNYLTWEFGTGSVDGFWVYRKIDDGEYVLVGDLANTARDYSDIFSVDYYTTYHYKVVSHPSWGMYIPTCADLYTVTEKLAEKDLPIVYTEVGHNQLFYDTVNSLWRLYILEANYPIVHLLSSSDGLTWSSTSISPVVSQTILSSKIFLSSNNTLYFYYKDEMEDDYITISKTLGRLWCKPTRINNDDNYFKKNVRPVFIEDVDGVIKLIGSNSSDEILLRTVIINT
jgi:hypothetical protein